MSGTNGTKFFAFILAIVAVFMASKFVPVSVDYSYYIPLGILTAAGILFLIAEAARKIIGGKAAKDTNALRKEFYRLDIDFKAAFGETSPFPADSEFTTYWTQLRDKWQHVRGEAEDVLSHIIDALAKGESAKLLISDELRPNLEQLKEIIGKVHGLPAQYEQMTKNAQNRFTELRRVVHFLKHQREVLAGGQNPIFEIDDSFIVELDLSCDQLETEVSEGLLPEFKLKRSKELMDSVGPYNDEILAKLSAHLMSEMSSVSAEQVKEAAQKLVDVLFDDAFIKEAENRQHYLKGLNLERMNEIFQALNENDLSVKKKELLIGKFKNHMAVVTAIFKVIFSFRHIVLEPCPKCGSGMIPLEDRQICLPCEPFSKIDED